MRHLLQFARDRRGIAAIEFALLAPAFIMLLVGSMGVATMLFSNSSLQFAAEAGARCASVKTTVCRDAATTAAYAQDHYFGIGDGLAFACTGRTCGSSESCGNKVTATVEVVIDVGMARYATPLRAEACYP